MEFALERSGALTLWRTVSVELSTLIVKRSPHSHYFFWTGAKFHLRMSVEAAMAQKSVSPLEDILLLALARLGGEAYGMLIRREVVDLTSHDISIVTMYTCLERLQQVGYISSRIGDPTPERGGLPKRYFTLETRGLRVLVEQNLSIQLVPNKSAATSRA